MYIAINFDKKYVFDKRNFRKYKVASNLIFGLFGWRNLPKQTVLVLTEIWTVGEVICTVPNSSGFACAEINEREIIRKNTANARLTKARFIHRISVALNAKAIQTTDNQISCFINYLIRRKGNSMHKIGVRTPSAKRILGGNFIP